MFNLLATTFTKALAFVRGPYSAGCHLTYVDVGCFLLVAGLVCNPKCSAHTVNEDICTLVILVCTAH